jgi:16S rRNA C967 or C1407 C5-methylase (RsmB/RsmF family)
MGARKEGPSGAAAFDIFYREIYGPRWAGLKSALLAERPDFTWSRNLARPYPLDPASVLAALSLSPCAEGKYLDLCAAPGGKSLILSSRFAHNETLVCNELSRERSGRLRRVLDEHARPESAARIKLISADGALLCKTSKTRYERILLDAPCSSERHVLAQPEELTRFSLHRPKAIAFRQWALLASAFLLLSPGGELVYSTCALNPGENEGMAARLEKKHPGEFEFLPPRESIEAALAELGELAREDALMLGGCLAASEAKGPGLMFMPDRGPGCGPIYLCRLRKLPLGD